MKKFSKITGEKVGIQTEKEVPISEYDILKYKIHNLMDSYLGVQMYGPITRYSVAGTTKVIGKDMFVEALMDVLEEFSSNEKLKLLEGLKFNNSNWELLDNHIDSIKEHLNNVTNSKIRLHKNKIKFIIEKSKDQDDIFNKIQMSVSKIKNPKTFQLRSIAAKEMMFENIYSKDLLQKVSEIYNQKYLDTK